MGPAKDRPFFSDNEIEEVCISALKERGLLPERPSAIRIDRFIEKHFVAHTYQEMPDGILGYTKFGSSGVEEIIVSQSLEEEGDLVSSRRVRTTLAHEAGHGLLHAYLFATGKNIQKELFDTDHGEDPKILCRDINSLGAPTSGYSGRWWEFQANKAMGSLLMPRALVDAALEPLMEGRGLLGTPHLPEARRGEAVRQLSEIFDVNPAVARIRIQGRYPELGSGQMAL